MENDQLQPLIPEAPLPFFQKRAREVRLSPSYVHDLALQAWLNARFFVADGYPIPVVFSTPMGAFSEANLLWRNANNPFAALLGLKDECGASVYEPYPANIRYPIISVKRGEYAPSTARSWSLHRNRRMYYPTESADVTRNDLHTVAQNQMPSGWDFSYQIEIHSTRPDTQFLMVDTLMSAFSLVTGRASARIPVAYPGHFGINTTSCWMTLAGNVVPIVEDATNDMPTLYRVSATVTVEGYRPDLDVSLRPALWYLAAGTLPLPDGQLRVLYPQEDLRTEGVNTSFLALPHLPPATL